MEVSNGATERGQQRPASCEREKRPCPEGQRFQSFHAGSAPRATPPPPAAVKGEGREGGARGMGAPVKASRELARAVEDEARRAQVDAAKKRAVGQL